MAAKEPAQMGTLLPPSSCSGMPTSSSQEWVQSPNPAPSSNSSGYGPSALSGKVGKKRSRASRRAPTTVLRTDASNFRSMVQEFTGIPSVPEPLQGDSKYFHNYNVPSMSLAPNYNNCSNYSAVPQYYGLQSPLPGSWNDFLRLNAVTLNQQYPPPFPSVHKVARTAATSRFPNLESVDPTASAARWVNPSMNQIV